MMMAPPMMEEEEKQVEKQVDYMGGRARGRARMMI